MISRREPLLWLQLMALAVIPLELELLRLVLAGPAFGPAPAVERLLIWGLAVIAPGVLLWRRPADWASLLLVRIPPAKRTVDQRRISAIQQPLGLKAALVIGIALLLPLFWWIDRSALLVIDFSPTSNSSRLTALLLAGPLLTLMLWQWQQIVQAVWLLSRNDQTFETLTPLNTTDLQSTHLSLGLGVLLPRQLEWETKDESRQTLKEKASGNGDAQINQPDADPAPAPQQDPAENNGEAEVPGAGNEQTEVTSAETEQVDDAEASFDLNDSNAVVSEQPNEEDNGPDLDGEISADSPVEGADSAQPLDPDSVLSSESEPAETTADTDLPEPSPDETTINSANDDSDEESSAASVAIKPEQPTEEDNGPNLDGEIGTNSTVAGTDAETHHEEP